MRWPMLLTVTLALPLAAAPATFHVAPDGNDAAAGTSAAPFRTLERARDAVRTLKAKGLPAGGVTVELAPGIYRRTATLPLDAQDSGTSDAPIVWRAAQPGTVRLMGGVVVPPSALQPVTDAAVLAKLEPPARTAVRRVDLRALGVPEPGPEWATRFAAAGNAMELFCGGQRMTVARWPNEGWSRIVDLTGGQPFDVRGTWGDKVGKFTYEGDRPRRWVGEPDVWLHGYWFWDWSDGSQKVAALDPDKHELTLAPPAHHYGYRKKARWYAFNALSELDHPGEWYVDRDSWTLYLWPPAGAKDAELSLSLLGEPMVKLTEVSHVDFQGLTFEVSRGEGVQVQGGQRVLIAGCTFRDLARLAVRVEGGRDHHVRSCDLYRLGVGGISLNGGDRKTLTPCGHSADNNHIHHFAELVYTYQNAIRLSGVGCRMTHNLVHDTIHEALCYSGNDHVVEYNEVYNVCLEADDSGVIHQGRDWTWRGNVIRYNFFHDVTAGNAVSNMGVYLDDMECGVDVYGNVLYRIPRAILVGGGRDNQVRNNLIIDCPIAMSLDNRAMNWASYHVGTTMKGLLDKVPYRDDPWRTRYPKLATIWEDEPAVPKGNVVTGNLLVRSGEIALAPEVPKYGEVANNLSLKTDPGFADPGSLDFRLKDVTSVQKQLPGWQPIPFEQIGLQLDDFRKALPVGNPVINPASRPFVESLTVEVRRGRGNPDAVLHYTLDGSEPTAASPVLSGPLKLTDSATVKAVAVSRDGRDVSGVSTERYTVQHLGPNGGVPLAGLPFSDGLAHGGIKVDTNYAGTGPVSLGGKAATHSLMMCPEAGAANGRGHATFELTGGLEQATLFTATIGIDDTVKAAGSATFIVEVLRAGKWEQVFASGIVRGGQSQAIRVPIAGATALRLSTTDAGDNIHSDHAVWAEPMVQ